MKNKVMKSKVEELLKNLKNFNEAVQILESIPADLPGAQIRGLILDYMENRFPKEFEEWL